MYISHNFIGNKATNYIFFTLTDKSMSVLCFIMSLLFIVFTFIALLCFLIMLTSQNRLVLCYFLKVDKIQCSLVLSYCT